MLISQRLLTDYGFLIVGFFTSASRLILGIASVTAAQSLVQRPHETAEIKAAIPDRLPHKRRACRPPLSQPAGAVRRDGEYTARPLSAAGLIHTGFNTGLRT